MDPKITRKLLRPDDGGQPGGGTNNPGTTPNPTPDGAGNNTGGGGQPGGGSQQPTAPNNPAPTTPTLPTLTLTQVQLDAMIKDRLDRDREERQAEAERKLKEKNGEFQPLYEALQPKYDKLEKTVVPGLQERVTKLEEQISKGIDDDIANWPDVLKELDPSKLGNKDLEARMLWYNTARKHVVAAGNRPILPGSGFSPTPAGNGAKDPASSYISKTYAQAEKK